MRIIAGRLKGRQFSEPHKHRMHPMGEKIRGALFNALGDIEGLTFLDAFAGTGALAFEAVSRGAAHVTAIEKDGPIFKVLAKNLDELDLKDKIHLTRANAGGWSDNNPEKQFDIVLLDPPYDDVKPNLLEKMAAHVKSGGLVVISLPPKSDFSLSTNYQLLSTKSYGDALLIFYRKK